MLAGLWLGLMNTKPHKGKFGLMRKKGKVNDMEKEKKDFLVLFGELGARIFKDKDLIEKYKDHPQALLNPQIPEGVSPAYWILTEDKKIDVLGKAGRVAMAEKIKKAQDDESFFKEIASYSKKREKQIAILEEIFSDGKFGLQLNDALSKLEAIDRREIRKALEVESRFVVAEKRLREFVKKMNFARVIDFILAVTVSTVLNYLINRG